MDAKERFEETRRAVRELHSVQLSISENGDDWKPDNGRASNVLGDPTANRACFNVSQLGDLLQALRQREAELIRFIGTTLAILQAVREGLGNSYADILEQRYIDDLPWKKVELSGKRVPLSTGKMKVNIAFDWIDSMGVSNLLRGEKEL